MDPPGGDDKWKLSSKGRSRSGRPHAMTDASSSSAGGSSSVLSRSYSASVATTRTGSSSSSSSSSCQQQQQRQPQQGSKKKCVAEAVKEHRARFYIVRRCVSMLVCWRDY
ncbi:hypothetical protein SETIT_5G468300v2 [Setaria italica]|uniref:Uncharacterized protein n=1 Tax=Setaria italica TaxID=4555 RepID=A0A368RG99_SETIT|nr:vitellogenin-A1 [Setaria italica]RCV29237.1 hypothetical protein SETIT_5G468300v2 [Setaria italica]